MNRQCPVCDRQFVVTRFRRVTCSRYCSQNRYTKTLKIVTILCKQCGVPFLGNEKRKFCTPKCYREWHRTGGPETAPVNTTTPYYVYAWFDESTQLPYYVGSGTGSRATQQHGDLRKPHRVELIKENLTLEGAHFCESVCIRAFALVGACLENINDPMVRSPLGPLEMEGAMITSEVMITRGVIN